MSFKKLNFSYLKHLNSLYLHTISKVVVFQLHGKIVTAFILFFLSYSVLQKIQFIIII